MDYCAITFVSTHAAITAQRALTGVCPFQTMPVLREISRGCGISIRFAPPCLDAVRTALEHTLPADQYSFYAVAGTGGALTVENIPQKGPDVRGGPAGAPCGGGKDDHT